MVPADDQAMVFPCASVMVIMVLLKVAFTCATPEAMGLRSRRRARAGSLPILNPLKARHCHGCNEPPILRRHGRPAAGLLLLPGYRLGRTLTRAGIGMGTLSANRQAPAGPPSPGATHIHQPIYFHGQLAGQIS